MRFAPIFLSAISAFVLTACGTEGAVHHVNGTIAGRACAVRLDSTQVEADSGVTIGLADVPNAAGQLTSVPGVTCAFRKPADVGGAVFLFYTAPSLTALRPGVYTLMGDADARGKWDHADAASATLKYGPIIGPATAWHADSGSIEILKVDSAGIVARFHFRAVTRFPEF